MTRDFNSMTHALKIVQPFFNAVLDGSKTFEIRKNDRDFREGDRLRLEEFDQVTGKTGRFVEVEVTYVLHGPAYGLAHGHCIMSITTGR